MIYFVDEDVAQLRPFRAELIYRGYNVKILTDADLAFATLSGAQPEAIQLAIIDVMLATATDELVSRYSRSDTNNFHQTGLILLEDLVKSNAAVFPKHAVFLTHATNDALFARIKMVADKHNMPLLRKRDFESALAFGDKIQAILDTLKKATK
ncbi:MAG TPA: hypothetical protein VHB20_07565 [Verrucomicrobiae bacterium]|jgi:hypothetical protein|nr:hypothetical protein [Verrucomicrobiae bacterium]